MIPNPAPVITALFIASVLLKLMITFSAAGEQSCRTKKFSKTRRVPESVSRSTQRSSSRVAIETGASRQVLLVL